MKYYLLDTSALLTLRDDEDGADSVAELLHKAQDGKCKCFVCFLSLMEILYRLWKDENELAARLAYEECQFLPIKWIHETKKLLEASAKIKATSKHKSLMLGSPPVPCKKVPFWSTRIQNLHLSNASNLSSLIKLK